MAFIKKKMKDTWAYKKPSPQERREIPLEEGTSTIQNHIINSMKKEQQLWFL